MDIEIYTQDLLKKIHKYSYANKEEIIKSLFVGCFYCLRIFNPNEINEWVIDKPNQTALCPFCGIDSVIGDYYIKITKELLIELYNYSFKVV